MLAQYRSIAISVNDDARLLILNSFIDFNETKFCKKYSLNNSGKKSDNNV